MIVAVGVDDPRLSPMKEPVVYLLRGQTGRFYIGSTNDLRRRLEQHNSGQVYSTKRLGLPMELVAKGNFRTLAEARSAEIRFKKWKNPHTVLDFLQKLDPSQICATDVDLPAGP